MIAIATAPKRDSRHWKQGEISWAELVGWLDHPADHKESGNYLLGTLQPDTTVVHVKGKPPCTNLHRRKDFVVSRSAVALDIDSPEADFKDTLELVFPYAAILHTTFSSAPDAPRYRLLIPTDREMTPDEYVAVASSVMADLGAEQFDPGTTQPERYMFKPSAHLPGWFDSVVLEGDPLPVDVVLEGFEEDLSTKPLPKPHRNKRDPFTLDGVIGAFNTAYDDINLLIDTYDLPYVPADNDRWQLVGARAVAGMGPVAPGLFFSHHVSDPAYGETCSSFDLVRLHRFGELDEDTPVQTPVNRRPSHNAMLEVAAVDPRVTAALVGVAFDDPSDNPDKWKLALRRTPRSGEFLDVISNWDLVCKHDPAFAGLYFNEFSLSVETDVDLPWRELGDPVFTTVDRWALCHYIERVYGIRPTKALMDSLVDTTAAQRMVNPVRDYLNTLKWDGVERVETCLPGVEDTDHNRMVARKSMVAAVARIFEPGIKWDHTLVLFGPEGIGKTWWINKMAKGYSANLGRIGDKDTLLTMQRSWIMVSDEGHSLRKADFDQQKEFLTRTEDTFRMPYDRETVIHPRHCVIWGSTNDEVFLRRQEGNRRFLIVHCERRVDFTAITDDYVDQVWAEAMHLYSAGEVLFLDRGQEGLASEARERFIEEDALGGLIEAYLNRLVPADWDTRPPDNRKHWLEADDDGLVPAGTTPIDQVCSTQLWVEALGRRLGDHKRTDLLDITNAMKRIPGWSARQGRSRVPFYGSQMTFARNSSA